MRLHHLVPVLLLAGPLAAQTNAERVANDHYTRSHDYDLVHQRIEVGRFDWDSLTFEGRVATTLVARRPGMDSVVLDAGHLLAVHDATDARGGALRTTARGDTLVVHLARPAAFGDTVRFTLPYHGRVENGHGLTFLEPEGRRHRPRQIWSQGEAMDNHYWFPTYDFPNDKMTWEVVATVPAGYTAVSNGALVSDTHTASTRTMDWRQTTPSATYLVSLVVAPLVKISDSWRGKPVDYYVYREDSARARTLFRVTPDMIESYSKLTGVPYPWAKYAQTTVADFFGGMENVSATTLVDWLPDERAYLDRPWYQHILIPHELAHQWFGDYMTTSNWANLWLNEGFAEFMPGQYWKGKLGRAAEDDYYYDEYTQFMGIDSRRRMPLASLESNNIYPKGALVLKMLHDHLGDERFWASMNRFLTRHAYGNATTDDLRQAILEATGENLDWFFDQWMYKAGFPELTVTSTYDATARTVSLLVRQTQVDSATPRPGNDSTRFTTPAVFRMPVTVRVGTAAGDVTTNAVIDAREQTIVVPNVTSAPTMIVFDDGNRILKTLDFNQPTRQLATQLARDSALWNRAWVIDQLETRPADADALAAITTAARSADVATRVRAVGALAAFPAERALAAIEPVLADTSSRVRQAAVTALATVGGPRATTLAHHLWDTDRSYDVRAAALTALARLDSAGARPLFATALTVPSYRDVIQQAAIIGIARSGDTTFIDQLDQLITDQRLAASALGALASRGSTRALDVLTRRLDDEQPHVRQWALATLGARAGAAGTRRLAEVAPSLKHADTRKAAGEMLKRSGG